MANIATWHPHDSCHDPQCRKDHYGYVRDKNFSGHLDTPYFKIEKTDGSTVTIELVYVTVIKKSGTKKIGGAVFKEKSISSRRFAQQVLIEDAALANSLQNSNGIPTSRLSAVIQKKVKPILKEWKKEEQSKDWPNDCKIS